MKTNTTLFATKILIVTLLVLGCISTSNAWDLNGPTSVCACGSDKTPCHNIYSVSNYGINDQIKWYVYDTSDPYMPLTEHGDKYLASGTDFEIQFNNSPGTSLVQVTIFWAGVAISTKSIYVTRNLYGPDQVNDGTILYCNSNETITITQPDLTACDFHYTFIYTAPSGFLMSGTNFYLANPSGQTFNRVFSMTSPSSIASGAAGNFNASARWTEGSLSQDRDRTTPIWVGSPGVNYGSINGVNYSGGYYYVYGGSASLHIEPIAGASTNWYIASGSGSLSGSGLSASLTFSGNIRVVVEITNRCGTTSYSFYLTDEGSGGGMRIAPNPAKDKISLLFDNPNATYSDIQGLKFVDANNKVWYTSDYEQLKVQYAANKTIDILTKDFPRGTYFLHVQKEKSVEKYQIILE